MGELKQKKLIDRPGNLQDLSTTDDCCAMFYRKRRIAEKFYKRGFHPFCKSASSVSSLSLLEVILIARLVVLFIKLSAALLQNNHIREQYCKFDVTIAFSSNLAFFSLTLTSQS